MWHNLLGDSTLFRVLREIDDDTVKAAKADGCPCCGGPLDHAGYLRQPRGLPAAMEEDGYVRRPSLCCRRCRRRVTPRLLTFLGRCVYVSVVIVIGAAMTQGATPASVRKVCETTGASPRTVRRWLTWWREAFIRSRPWLKLRPSLIGVEESALPRAALDRFAVAAESALSAAMTRFLQAASADEVPRMA